MIKRKKGSTLIEIIVGLAIISILITISINIVINNNKVIESRKAVLKSQYILYCVMQEIKYNFTTEEINNLLGSQTVYISSDNFFERIINTNLFELRDKSDIKIQLINSDEKGTIKINIGFIDDDGSSIAERTFKKYKWMDKK